MTENWEIYHTAASLHHRGRLREAERLYRHLLQQTYEKSDRDYDEWMHGLVETYRQLGRLREAGHVLVYLQRFADAEAAFHGAGAKADAARARDQWARQSARSSTRNGPPAQAADLDVAAARAYLDVDLPVHAAIAFTRGGAAVEARGAWERVARHPRLAGRAYEQALCAFNLGRAAGQAGDALEAQRQLRRAQQLLEEVADDFESRGERERAFDCYSVLVQLGREERSFENVAEGYTNCIRICKEDNVGRNHVLQYYEDFLRLALEREEFHAAATVAREAADYARRLGLAYDRSYLERSAGIWCKAAEKNERDGGPIELSENAYLASVDALGALGDFYRVRETYDRLARLPLPDARKERYRRVSARYAGVARQPIEAVELPDPLRRPHVCAPIWEWDLLEWELDGDYAAVCAGIVGDKEQPAITRRRALQVLLLHLDAVVAGPLALEDASRLSAIAEGLGELQAYVVLRPLEKLSGHAHPAVRRGVMRACRNLWLKRTVPLVARGLGDGVLEVRRAALEALENLYVPEALDPLVRIFRGQPDQPAKLAALAAIARLATLEAGEFLIEVLRQETPPLRAAACRLLAGFDNRDIFPIVQRHLEIESGPARNDLLQVLRGVSPDE